MEKSYVKRICYYTLAKESLLSSILKEKFEISPDT